MGGNYFPAFIYLILQGKALRKRKGNSLRPGTALSTIIQSEGDSLRLVNLPSRGNDGMEIEVGSSTNIHPFLLSAPPGAAASLQHITWKSAQSLLNNLVELSGPRQSGYRGRSSVHIEDVFLINCKYIEEDAS